MVEKSITRENISEARTCFQRALAADPHNVDAHVGVATMDCIFATVFPDDNREARLGSAETHAKEALSLASNHAVAHFTLGTIYVWTRRAEEAIAEFARAAELDRNLAFAHAYAGCAEFVLGRAEATEARVQEALRLSPKDALSYVWLSMAGIAKLCLCEYDEAVAWFRRSIEVNRNYANAHFNLAAALAHLGRSDEARSAAKAGLVLHPEMTIRSYRARNGQGHPVYVAQTAHIIDGLRLAGVPEE